MGGEENRTQRIVFDGWQPCLLNVLLRLHPHARNRRLKTDAQVIGLAVRLQGIRGACGPRKVSLVVRSAKGRTPPDPDALWKGLLDGLVHSGALMDDDWKHLVLGSVTYERAPRKGLVVVLEDV